jgi:hypothetical protein
MSPFQSQATEALKNQSKHGIRRLLSKFTGGYRALQITVRIEYKRY